MFALWVFFFVLAQSALAAQKNVVIMPFSADVPKNMAYLSKAVPSAVQSKLSQSGGLSAHMSQAKANSSSEARSAMVLIMRSLVGYKCRAIRRVSP